MTVCDCSHPLSMHDDDGRCAGADITLWGEEKICTCMRYQWQGAGRGDVDAARRHRGQAVPWFRHHPHQPVHPVSLPWRYERAGHHKSITVAESSLGMYQVEDATIWENSRVKEIRQEAALYHPGGRTHLGYYPLAREAIEACEQHFKENT